MRFFGNEDEIDLGGWNAEFDDWLKDRNPSSGIRDFEWVMELAKDSGLTFVEDRSMPANNQFLAFRRL